MLYLDTSALLPYYRQEAHSPAIQRLLLRGDRPVLISDLTRLEFASALSRWVRMHEVEERHAQRLSRAFDDDIKANRYTLCRNTLEHTDLARQWLLARNTSLRTLDGALHAAAIGLGIKVHDL